MIRHNEINEVINGQYGSNDWEKIWWSQRDIFETSKPAIQLDIEIPRKLPSPTKPIPSYTATWLESDLVPNPI